MKKLSLKKRWDQNKSVVNGWCSIPSTVTTEIMSLNNFHSLTVDLQHGLVDYQQALNMIQSMGSGEITPLARVPWNEPGIIMKLLDAGFLGIICPMINNENDCKQFVQTTKYVPQGFRSSGPTRAALIHGSNYHDEANEHIITLAMIETEEGLDNVEKISSVEDLSGVYIGPSDLSVSLGLKPGLDRTEEVMINAIDKIKIACKKNNKKIGIHCLSPNYLNQKFQEGFDLATIGTDLRFFVEIVGKKLSEIHYE